MSALSRKNWRLCYAVVYLPLILSLWHAPLPWLHSHDADDEAIAGFGLHRHLDQFHGDAPQAAADESGWHWHFAWACQIAGCDGCPWGGQSGEPGTHFPTFDYGVIGSASSLAGSTAVLESTNGKSLGLFAYDALLWTSPLQDARTSFTGRPLTACGRHAIAGPSAQSLRAAIQVYLL